MTYGLGTRALNRNTSSQPMLGHGEMRRPLRSWRALDESRRLELVERALLPMNERIDTFPLAL